MNMSGPAKALAETIQAGLCTSKLAKDCVEREREKKAWDDNFAALQETVTISNKSHDERSLGFERGLEALQETVTTLSNIQDERGLRFERRLEELQETVTASNSAHDERVLGFERGLKELQGIVTASNTSNDERFLECKGNVEYLRETVATLYVACDDHKGEVDFLRETVKVLQEEVKALQETVTALNDDQSERLSKLEVAHADTTRSPEQVSHPVADDAKRKIMDEKDKVIHDKDLRNKFVRHLLATRKLYRSQKLGKDQRPSIWLFIEGITHEYWGQGIQEYLLRTLPNSKVWLTKFRNNGRYIDLSPELKWEEVYKVLEHKFLNRR